MNTWCKCGHTHFAAGDYCSGCHVNTIHEFRPDNLRYLENIYD